MIKYFVAFLLFIGVTGCSSVYTVRDYNTKEEFRQNFNDFLIDKNTKIILVDDSVYQSVGVFLENDSLYSLGQAMPNSYVKIPASEIRDIEYNKYHNDEGLILLKDDEKFNGVKIHLTNDSLEFYSDIVLSCKSLIAPVYKIKEVRYNSKWGRISTKIAAGAAAGMVAGFAIGTVIDDHSYYQGRDHAYTSCLLGIPLGALCGVIWGSISGFTYIYKFTP